MPVITFAPFLFLGSTFFSLWLKREPRIWGTLLCLSLFSGLIAGNITWFGLFVITLFAFIWIFYDKKPNTIAFFAIIIFSISFKLRLIPGYNPLFINSKFAIGLENSLIGLFPLALIVPIAKDFRDWLKAFKGLAWGCVGIAFLAILAIVSGATHLDLTIPSHLGTRVLSNLVLTCIPEEGFYRGFIQSTLCRYFRSSKTGNIFSLMLTSLLFSASHIYWSPDLGVLAFTFLASLLYGSVYLFSGKIESAILCHFLFNLIHMIFFSYHAN